MEIALNPTSASDPNDQTRPQDDVAAGDDAFGMLLAMALQSAVIVTSQAPPADATPDPATTSAEMDAGPDGTGAANGVSAPARLDSDVTGPIPSGPQSAPVQAANAEVSLYFEESPEVINLEQIAETLGRPQNAGPQVPASASAVDPDGLLDADGLQTPSPGANPPTEEAHHLGFG